MKRLLILDIDSTLSYSMEHDDLLVAISRGYLKDRDDSDFLDQGLYPTIRRPHVTEFLKWAFDNFTVGVWTSRSASNTDYIIDKLFIELGIGTPLFVYTHGNCVLKFRSHDAYYRGDYTTIKDLKKLRKFGFTLDDMIAVDDSSEKLQRQYSNLVRVRPFYGDPSDNHLLQLRDYLTYLKDAPRLRRIEKRDWDRRQHE